MCRGTAETGCKWLLFLTASTNCPWSPPWAGARCCPRCDRPFAPLWGLSAGSGSLPGASKWVEELRRESSSGGFEVCTGTAAECPAPPRGRVCPGTLLLLFASCLLSKNPGEVSSPSLPPSRPKPVPKHRGGCSTHHTAPITQHPWESPHLTQILRAPLRPQLPGSWQGGSRAEGGGWRQGAGGGGEEHPYLARQI